MNEELQNPSWLECVERLQKSAEAARDGVKESMTAFTNGIVEFAGESAQLATIHGVAAHERTITKRSVDWLERSVKRLQGKTISLMEELNAIMNETNKMAARSKRFDEQKGLN